MSCNYTNTTFLRYKTVVQIRCNILFFYVERFDFCCVRVLRLMISVCVFGFVVTSSAIEKIFKHLVKCELHNKM